jgi:lauroyl/myristoyl acyltransferase
VIFMNREVEAAGARWVHLGGAFPVLSALLERGELVFMFFDRPGRLPSRLGGRPAMLSGAVGDLLLHSGAVAVPAFAVHRRGRIRGELREPLEVRPGESSEAVVHRLAAEFDDVIEKYGGQALPLLAEAWRAGAAETAHKHLGE